MLVNDGMYLVKRRGNDHGGVLGENGQHVIGVCKWDRIGGEVTPRISYAALKKTIRSVKRLRCQPNADPPFRAPLCLLGSTAACHISMEVYCQNSLSLMRGPILLRRYPGARIGRAAL
jgi:hypothetical protein